MPEFNTIGYFLNLFVLIPFALLLFFAMPTTWAQKLVLIFLGIFLLATLAPRLALFYLCLWTLVWLIQQGLPGLPKGASRRLGLAAAIIFLLTPLVWWKLYSASFLAYYNLYFNALTSHLSSSLGLIDLIKPVIIPLGISFSIFRAIDLLVQTHIGALGRQRLIDVFTYGFFPPILVVGPVSEYLEVTDDYAQPKRYSASDIREGCKRILIGLFKLYILAFPLSASANVLAGINSAPVWMLWYRLGLFAWFLYLNFSGFSDLAIGCARMMGFSLKENFDKPFFQTGPQQFWNHWHMSLTRFAQRNVFVPAGGYRRRTQYRAIFVTMFVIALWHDLSIGMLIFGLYHATALVLQRWWEGRRPRGRKVAPDPRALSLAKGFGTFVFVALSFPLLVVPKAMLLHYYLSLLGIR
jgi:D-alanyl-lipoteichoic acid acyltransferase DltB (MBOAT superfamily)